MAARLVSFTKTLTLADLEHAMATAMLNVQDDVDLATMDDATARVLYRQLVTMAAAFADLSAELGIASPAVVETTLTGFDTIAAMAG